MANHQIPRYQTEYRADEIRLIINFALRGESLGLMGLAGIGKSNIVNYLRDIRRHSADREISELYFPIVDASYWEGTPGSLWKMMAAALKQATQALPLPADDNKVVPISDEERALAALQGRLQKICQERGSLVMFILDDFDTVLDTGPLAMLERLNGLRSEGNREKLSYLIFTKRLPHVLGRRHDLENKSKFYDLFRHNLYALEPYTQEDARQMLLHLNDLAGKPLRVVDLAPIRELAGGHAMLLKIIFNLCVQEGMPNGDAVKHFVEKPDVQQECRRILQNLHPEEGQAAVRAAQGQQTPTDEDLLDHLARRGLLVKRAPVTWFSPVWAQFLKSYSG